MMQRWGGGRPTPSDSSLCSISHVLPPFWRVALSNITEAGRHADPVNNRSAPPPTEWKRAFLSPEQSGRASNTRPLRVLIVEDEALIAMLLADSLEGAGHAVVGPAASMAEAMEFCAGAPPDLALLDITLRGRGSGVDLACALSERWGVVSIFASGMMLDDRRARSVALGLIRKPFGVQTVLRSVELAGRVMGGAGHGPVPAGFEMFPTAG